MIVLMYKLLKKRRFSHLRLLLCTNHVHLYITNTLFPSTFPVSILSLSWQKRDHFQCKQRWLKKGAISVPRTVGAPACLPPALLTAPCPCSCLRQRRGRGRCRALSPAETTPPTKKLPYVCPEPVLANDRGVFMFKMRKMAPKKAFLSRTAQRIVRGSVRWLVASRWLLADGSRDALPPRSRRS